MRGTLVSFVGVTLLTAAAAQAQVAFDSIDADGDGRLSYEEMAAALGDTAAFALWNRNGGQPLSQEDILRINAEDEDSADEADDGGPDLVNEESDSSGDGTESDSSDDESDDGGNDSDESDDHGGTESDDEGDDHGDDESDDDADGGRDGSDESDEG